MRFGTLRTSDGTTAVRAHEDIPRGVQLPFPDVGAILNAEALDEAATLSGASVEFDEGDLAPPVLRPSKVVCLGMNYLEHVREMGDEIPPYPTLFAKFATNLIGPRDDIILPYQSEKVDWEVELAVVIGAPIRHAGPQEVARAIAGYTVINDITARDWQFRTPQWLQGKAFDGSTPIGPFVVTPDEIADPQNLRMTCSVDGQAMQDSSTKSMVFPIFEHIAYISRVFVLNPGDIIATGTPFGAGWAQNPPTFLKSDQILESWIEGIGTLRNRCIPDPESKRV